MLIKMFKAQRQSNRFRKNQKVWVTVDFANHAFIRFKWRGNGRYVNGVIPKFIGQQWNKDIGEDGFKEIEVDDEFAKRLEYREGAT